MALQKTFPKKDYGEQADAYILADLTLDNKTKTGRLELAVWDNKDYRENNAPKINNVPIPIGATEAWLKKEEVKEGEVDAYPDYEVGADVYIQTLAWDDFVWKSGLDVYTKIKTLRILSDGQIVDMSDSIDC